MYEQLELSTLDCVVTPADKLRVNVALATIANQLQVVGYQQTEDGWELMVEGPVSQVAEFINLWKGDSHE